MKTIVELSNVHKEYVMGKVIVKALCGVSLKIKDEDFVALVGASGSGKSTAMHVMGCLDLPTRGKVIFEGRDVSNLGSDELADIRGERVGFVFQMFNLMPASTALENVMLPLTFRNNLKEDPQERAVRILKELGLGNRLNHRPAELSGGEQQRTAIARALINDPELVLADEPTGNLDSKTGNMIMNYFRKINRKQGKTIVLVTHDMNLAKKTDKILRIKDGKLS